MKISNFILLLAMVSLTISSCKKTSDEPNRNPKIKVESYIPMAIGNMWVYQIFNIDSAGNETTSPEMIDTTIVIGDTIINNFEYYVVEKQSWLFKDTYRIFLRNSSGDLVNEKGEIQFSESNFTDSIHICEVKDSQGEVIFTTNGIMKRYPQEVTVPAGIFKDNLILDAKMVIDSKHGPSPKTQQRIHAKGVGMILDELLFSSTPIGAKIQKRLFKYSVE